MRIKAAALAVLCLALQASAFALHPAPEASSVGKKGPVQLTLRLYKTRVRVKKSLWFQLELKNIGKEKIWVSERAFRDMWQLFRNCHDQFEVYIEVKAVGESDGEPALTASGERSKRHKGRWRKNYLRPAYGPFPPVFLPHYDYVGGPDDPVLGKALNDRLDKLEAQWVKEGLSDQQRSIKRHDFWGDWNKEMQTAEDRAKSFWFVPGASTATAAWSYPGPKNGQVVEKELSELRQAKAFGLKAEGDNKYGPDEIIAEYDVEKQVGDYAQLWFFQFDKPGRYKVRAVYDYDVGYDQRRLARSPGYIEVKTAPIEFEVLP